jgi:hypothetical protein
LIKDIKEKLIGWGWDEEDKYQYEKYPKRTCELIEDFYLDL